MAAKSIRMLALPRIDADPVAAGILVGAVAILAVVYLATRLGRR